MERITIYVRTSKHAGPIRLRFRLSDGRGVQLFHKSNITASPQELSKFNIDGTLKKNVSIFNKDLRREIQQEIKLIHDAYNKIKSEGLEKTSEELCKAISYLLNPIQEKPKSLLDRFLVFIESGCRDGLFGEVRKKNYMVVYRIMERFLTIIDKYDIVPSDFDSDFVMDFSLFVRDEYKYVEKWKGIYNANYVPMKPRSANTVATKMKYVHAFFRELEERNEINKSPFQRLGRERKKVIMKERYDDPVYLYASELRTILDKEVPNELQEVKDCFCLQCAFGCRIGDFKSLNMDKVAVIDGVPYIHYLPHKTLRENPTFKEVETPIMKFAWDIIQKYRFKFNILKYVSGKSGYNVKIKRLLKFCGIDRRCKVFDEKKGDNVYVPLHKLASSKLCRKTHVDIMNKVQINQYVAGLHREGSKAVERYTSLELKDLFKLMCVAFGEPIYKIDYI